MLLTTDTYKVTRRRFRFNKKLETFSFDYPKNIKMLLYKIPQVHGANAISNDKYGSYP